jgi:hypothetical protein
MQGQQSGRMSPIDISLTTGNPFAMPERDPSFRPFLLHFVQQRSQLPSALSQSHDDTSRTATHSITKSAYTLTVFRLPLGPHQRHTTRRIALFQISKRYRCGASTASWCLPAQRAGRGAIRWRSIPSSPQNESRVSFRHIKRFLLSYQLTHKLRSRDRLTITSPHPLTFSHSITYDTPASPLPYQNTSSSRAYSPWLAHIVLHLHDVRGLDWMGIAEPVQRVWGVVTSSGEVLDILSEYGRVSGRTWWD